MYTISDVDGIIFDMDGVIFDSELIALEGWVRLGEKYGLTDVEHNAKKCIGRSTKDSMRILDEAYGDKIAVTTLYGECKTVVKEIIAERGLPIKPGAEQLLKWLNSNNVKTALASSTSYDTVVRQLTEAGLIDYFRIIVGGDMIENSKPCPDIYLLACDKLGVNPARTFAVEDSYNGILAAHAAGMMPILVPDLIEPNEEMLIKSYRKFDDLVQFLEKMKSTGV